MQKKLTELILLIKSNQEEVKMFDKSTSYMLSVAASIYGVLAYTIAFSLEIWFIFNSDNLEETASFTNKNHHHHEQQTFIIPMTALVQASIYFVLVILSLFLVLGVIIKSIVCLLCWIIGVLLAFLPECALVIYTCLNVWVCVFLTIEILKMII